MATGLSFGTMLAMGEIPIALRAKISQTITEKTAAMDKIVPLLRDVIDKTGEAEALQYLTLLTDAMSKTQVTELAMAALFRLTRTEIMMDGG